MRKLLAASVVAVITTTLFAQPATPQEEEPELVPSKISIYTSADGLFGYVTSDHYLCMRDRRVDLRLLGEGDYGRGWVQRALVGHGSVSPGLTWHFKTRETGRFKAVVDAAGIIDKRRGTKHYTCLDAESEIQTRLLQGSNDQPECPDATDMCRVPRFTTFVRWRNDDACRDFDQRIGWRCQGEMLTDEHPFAEAGAPVDVSWVKTSKSRYVSLESFSGDSWTVRLAGRLGRKGWLVDRGEYASRPLCAFRTPSLPGLDKGEPGGRLLFNHREKDGGLYVTVEGYLYLTDHEPRQETPCLDQG